MQLMSQVLQLLQSFYRDQEDQSVVYEHVVCKIKCFVSQMEFILIFSP